MIKILEKSLKVVKLNIKLAKLKVLNALIRKKNKQHNEDRMTLIEQKLKRRIIMTEKKTVEEIVKEKVEEMEDMNKKESIFGKAKKVLTSKAAKEIYMTMAAGILQGVIAKYTFDTLNKTGEDNTVIEIED